MGTRAIIQSASLAVGLILLGLSIPGLAADLPAPSDAGAKPSSDETSDAQRSLRAFLQLQEQMHSALLAIDEARQAAEVAAKRNTEALTERLKSIEQAIAQQREHEMESIQSLNRLVLIAVGVFAGIGLVGLFCTGWLQLRAMNRLAEVATPHLSAPVVGHVPIAGALPAGAAPADIRGASPGIQAGLRGVIERLDERVADLEAAAHVRIGTEAVARKNGGAGEGADEPAQAALGAPAEPAPATDGLSLLLGKGQALIHLGQAEKALACFEEALALDPDNAEALVKRGGALERLDRLEEAIACYDRAIAVNDSMTLAYLQKGGVCNRLERFDEALKCYEQALRVQEKG